MLVHGFWAQSTFTAKVLPATIHPFGDPTAHLQPYKLDPKARVVLSAGIFFGYERFVYKDLVSVKVIQGFFLDCSAGKAGVSHIGLRVLVYENSKNRFYCGLGPIYLYRESWNRFGDAYTGSGFFRNSQTRWGEIQHRFFPFGIDLEYDRVINEHNSFSVSCTPGVPLAVILTFGWKHWFNKPTYEYNRIHKPIF